MVRGVIAQRDQWMVGEIAQLRRRKRTVHIVHRTERIGTKLHLHFAFSFCCFQAFQPLYQVLDLLTGDASYSRPAFHDVPPECLVLDYRSEEHTSELQSL